MADEIGLTCSECKNRNYVTYINKKNMNGKLQISKYCKHCKKESIISIEPKSRVAKSEMI